MAKLAAHTRTTKQIRRIGDMLGRLGHWRHSGKDLAVVAIGATVDDARVLHQRSRERYEVSGRMAGLT